MLFFNKALKYTNLANSILLEGTKDIIYMKLAFLTTGSA